MAHHRVAAVTIEVRARPVPAPAAPNTSAVWDWVATVDHKRIGLLYLATGLVFFLVAGLMALVMRAQLTIPNNRLLQPEVYNQLFTTHGTTMIFFVLMPAVFGFANYVVPLQIGARDMAFPRLNALSYWLFLFGALLFYFSFLAGGGPDAGWFAYPPLSIRPYSWGAGLDYWALGLLISGIGSIVGSLNLLVTIAALRAPGMTVSRLPLFVWTIVVASFLVIWGMPTLTAVGAMIVLDRLFGASFFAPRLGGDPVLYQHLFWWLGHPEVYIIFLPFTGIVSEVIPVFSRKPIFGYGFISASTVFIGFYSLFVWGHHMLAVGLPNLALGFFSGASLLIGLPTGIKIFNWLATMWGGAIRTSTALLFCVGLIVNFTLGGLTGIAVALVPFDWQVTDSYYIVAHFHYTMIGGSLNGLFAGVYYWFPKMTGRLLDERLGRWHFWLTMVGFNLTFFPMHIMGFLGMPRRVYTYPAGAGLTELNIASTAGAAILGLSVLVFLVNLWRSARAGTVSGPDPWGGATLEWSVSSPPPAENFAVRPVVRDRFPLWAAQHPDDRRVGAVVRGDPSVPLPERVGRGLAAVEPHRLAMLLFISSEAIFFVALIVTFLVHRDGPGAELARFDVLTTGLFSLALFASSGTIELAARRRERGDADGTRRWLLATAALGAIFLAGQGIEFSRLLQDGFALQTGIFGSAFYTLTGFHGLHVLGGLTAILLLWAAGDRRSLGRRGVAFGPISLYWHFVDLVWVGIFLLIYVRSLV